MLIIYSMYIKSLFYFVLVLSPKVSRTYRLLLNLVKEYFQRLASVILCIFCWNRKWWCSITHGGMAQKCVLYLYPYQFYVREGVLVSAHEMKLVRNNSFLQLHTCYRFNLILILNLFSMFRGQNLTKIPLFMSSVYSFTFWGIFVVQLLRNLFLLPSH